jgi:adenylate cyclase
VPCVIQVEKTVITHIEIERKWLLESLPELPWKSVLEIEQGYISRGDHEVRLRRTTTDGRPVGCILCRKMGQGLTRTETEVLISIDVFDLLWPLTEGHRLQKNRYIYEGTSQHTWEVDEYKHRLMGLFTAEVELSCEQEEVEMPHEIKAVLIKEVTGDPAYLNSTLARDTE